MGRKRDIDRKISQITKRNVLLRKRLADPDVSPAERLSLQNEIRAARDWGEELLKERDNAAD